MNVDFAYYWSIFWRRFPYFIVVASLLTSVGLIVAMLLPPEYEARATLLVESAKIPEQLAASTVRTAPTEQLQIIERRLMTRENLTDTAQRLGVVSRAEGEPYKVSQIVEEMRSRTTFAATTSRSSRRGPENATLVTIGFRAQNAQTAARVANEFVTLVLRENVEMRTALAGETLQFFEQEVERLSGELDTQSAEIVRFKNSVGRALPDSQEYLTGRQGLLQNRLAQIERDVIEIDEQKKRILALFEQARFQPDPQNASPQERALLEARDALDSALLVYSENSPRVRLLKARIAQLEKRVQAERLGVSSTAGDAKSSQQVLVDAQLAELEVRKETLNGEAAKLIAEIDEIEETLGQIAGNGLTLRALERELQSTQRQHSEAVDRLAKAATGERIELLSKGQRITVIEQATAPDYPSKPNRPLIAGAGAAAGIALGLGVVMLLELLNRSIRRPSEIVDRLGITPIAVLPYLRTDSEAAWRRTVLILIVCGLMLVLPVTIYFIHSLLVPLDGFANGILKQFGLALPGGGVN